MIKTFLKTKEKYHIKIAGLIVLILVFSLFYLTLDSTHFQGINPVQDQVKDDIVEKKSKKVSQEPFEYKQPATQELKYNIEQVVKEEEDKIEKPTIQQNFFDRFYFSTITACLLGYGDIYPTSNLAKFLSALQSFLTVCLILY